MPTIPKWLADTVVNVMEPLLYNAVAQDISAISEDLLRITFQGDFYSAYFTPGHEVQFRVNDNNFRHYTIATFEPERGEVSMIFYLNKKGPGSEWIRQLQKGDPVKFHAGISDMQYDKKASHHFFFGDETSVGLFQSYKEMSVANDHEYLGVLEMAPHNAAALSAINLLLETVNPTTDAPAINAIQWMEDMHPHCWEVWKKATYYLAGRTLSIQHFRKYLLQRGISSRQIKTAPYWTDGKKGI